MAAYVPARGDVVWLTLEPRVGHEQGGRRPAVVLSPEPYNARIGLALLCPVSRQVKGYPFEVELPPGLGVGGVILSDQAKSLDWRAGQAEFLARLPAPVLQQVFAKLGALLEEPVE